jgi:hypothetical protein
MQVSAKARFSALQIREIEKVFVHVAIDLREILVLDSIEKLSAPPSIRIRSHDLHGALPEILVRDSGERDLVLDMVQNEAAKLIAVVKIRDDLAEMFPGCEFLLPIRTESGVVAGFRFKSRTVLAEEPTCWESYHRLMKNAKKYVE